MTKNVLRLVIVVIAGAITGQVNAQDVGFGIKGGLNLTNLNVKDAQGTYDSRTGYHAGFFVRGKFNKVALQPEVLLFTQSNKINYANLTTAEQNFTYLAVPVMIKLYPVAGLNIQAGPQFGFLLDGERKTTTSTQLGSLTTKKDIKDYYKSSDVAISVGAGYDFNFGLGIDARYNIGVQDINNASTGETVKSQVFLISIGWNFLD